MRLWAGFTSQDRSRTKGFRPRRWAEGLLRARTGWSLGHWEAEDGAGGRAAGGERAQGEGRTACSSH